MATLAEVLQRCGPAYLREHPLSSPQAKAWRGICACRTPALGGQRLACSHCGHSHWHYHSCRNRHCPQCGARAKDAWLQGRLAEVLDVPYAHLVFTLPHQLHSLYRSQPRWVIDTLFACTARTLGAFCQWHRTFPHFGPTNFPHPGFGGTSSRSGGDGGLSGATWPTLDGSWPGWICQRVS